MGLVGSSAVSIGTTLSAGFGRFLGFSICWTWAATAETQAFARSRAPSGVPARAVILSSTVSSGCSTEMLPISPDGEASRPRSAMTWSATGRLLAMST